MKSSIKVVLLSLGLFFLTSCEDVIQVELDQGAKLYVIDAFLSDLREDPVVVITESANYFSNTAAPIVSNAQVVLKDLTDNKVYNFNYTSNGRYSFPLAAADTIAKVGHQYELNVSIDGEVYTSLCTQKRTAAIDSIKVFYDEGNSGFGPGTPFYYCELAAKDKVDQVPDYYWIKTFRNDTLFGEPGDLNTSIDGTNGEVKSGNDDSLAFTPPIIYLGFEQYKFGDRCKVEIHSISRETNNFLIQAVAQIQNGGLFATTPENVRTNIVTPSTAKIKAIGWFNMATVTSKTQIIQ